ncbi:MAG TPA: ParB N-terminal domain-containing protein, partial [Thermodesulfobacteriota bacterium]|nr:ParB N-terminal domain-containing protein [Thermodesulfobacteriota bacterium]
MDTPKRRALGKGLAALLPPPPPPAPGLPAAGEADAAGRTGGYFLCKIEDIKPGSQQPRRQVDEAELAALAESIAAQGVLQPVIVRPARRGGEGAAGGADGDGAAYELVAGERRWRAA